eukprot:scaffold22937_cov60-Phaeocystis_antarctica.AAC.4
MCCSTHLVEVTIYPPVASAFNRRCAGAPPPRCPALCCACGIWRVKQSSRKAVDIIVVSSVCARASSGCVSVEVAAEVAGGIIVAGGGAPLWFKRVGH